MNEIDKLNQALMRHNKRNNRLSIGIIIVSLLMIAASAIVFIQSVSI